ncbi:General transcription factor 3C polypeptide 1 [Araneus ventricosus]|uniref:General transcription factor 3C polypeptide 1 n=1 Tax=Araneus ventricosus TaxID=182803 RepID=A0A4Y2Q5F8_ARAVE|nr:General transcription factor 3C polypeptide 1 [Araneus ventricosus]
MPKDYDFLSGLLDEVALEGLDGITLAMLWQRLRDRRSFSIPVDEYSKIFFWKIVARHKDIEIYELPKPRKFYPIYNRYDHMDPELGIVTEPEKLDPDPYAPVVPIEEGVVRGSCSTYDKRKCITSEIRHDNVLLVSLKEAEDTWGDSLVLVASPKLRLLTLIGTVTNPLIDLSLEAYCLLERIGRSRYLGAVTQGEEGLLKSIGSICNDLHIHEEYLISKGLIKSQKQFMKRKGAPICTYSLFHLTRFYEEREEKITTWMKKLCDVLKDKPQKQEKFAVLEDEMKMPGDIIRELINGPLKGCVEIITLQSQEFHTEENVCRLVKDFNEDTDDNKPGDLPANIHFDSSKIFYGVPLVHQLYSHIKNSGTGGLSTEDLGRRMTLPRSDIEDLLFVLSSKGHIIKLHDTVMKKDKYVSYTNAKEDKTSKEKEIRKPENDDSDAHGRV